MKFIFIINPAAGKKNNKNDLLEQIENHSAFEHEIYYTKEKNDAINYIDQYCKLNPSEEKCFVAVGGDGTINEVTNGVVGKENTYMGIWPVGSGNDYVKYFGDKEEFLKLDELINGKMMEVDTIKAGNRYSINIVGFGFDCQVLKIMEKNRGKFILGGKNSYPISVFLALFTGLSNEGKVYCDGELLNPEGKYLLCTVANGNYIGGQYYCSPRSIANDGLADVCLVKTMPLHRIIPLIDKYQKGLHLDDESLKDVIVYRQGKKVEVFSNSTMTLNADGELMEDKKFNIEIVEKSIKLILPKQLVKE